MVVADEARARLERVVQLDGVVFERVIGLGFVRDHDDAV